MKYKTIITWSYLTNYAKKIFGSDNSNNKIIESDDIIEISLKEQDILQKTRELDLYEPTFKRNFKIDAKTDIDVKLLNTLKNHGNTVISNQNYNKYGEKYIIDKIKYYLDINTRIVTHKYPICDRFNRYTGEFEYSYTIERI